MSGRTDAGQARAALSGVVVADFSRVLAGPLATMLLADLGATVVKVERPGCGDDTRRWGPPFVGPMSTYFLSLNRNKRSVTLDLASEEGRRAARALAERADVMVENFRPGRLAQFGLDFETLRERNPRLIYCSISGFGEGKGATLPGYDAVVQAMGGLMSLTGEESVGGMKVGIPAVDVFTGLYATIGVLGALAAREATGRGQLVRTSLLGCLLASMVNHGTAYLNTGTIPRALGNRHPSIVPYEPFETADGSLLVAVGNDGQFRALCEVLDAGHLADDERFVDNPHRVANREALTEWISKAFQTRTTSSLWQQLTAAGVPCGPVNDLAAAFALAEQLGLHAAVTLPSDVGDVTLLGNPIELTDTPMAPLSAPPLLGADTGDVLAWLENGIEGTTEC